VVVVVSVPVRLDVEADVPERLMGPVVSEPDSVDALCTAPESCAATSSVPERVEADETVPANAIGVRA
jgi:hypothetical protein